MNNKNTTYKRLGDYIRLVDVRNKDLKVKILLGLTINKEFITSVANTIGTNMKNYKIIRKNQFACSLMQVRRDKKIPIALLKDYDEAIISQAYPVFEIIDTNKLNPEYLMMWFRRPEFDRQACFLAVGGVRGSLEWEDFLDMQLPVPPIERQNEIVAEYNAVVNRIKLNDQLNQKLEETAQTIFKHWFVDFEFPNEQGKPYKSSGGKMVWNEELEKEIPDGWRVSNLSSIADYLNGLAMQKFEPNDDIFLPVIKIKELNQGYSDSNSGKATIEIPSEYIIENGTVIFSWSGTLKVDIWCGGKGALNQHLFKVTSKMYPQWFYYLWTKHHLKEFNRIADGKKTSMGHIKREDLDKAKVLIPNKISLFIMDRKMTVIINNLINSKIESIKLLSLKDLLLSKMSKG